jgi:hypothetical protein
MMPESLANDSYENPNGIAFDARGTSRGCDEVSEIRFAAIKPLRSSGFCVEHFQS